MKRGSTAKRGASRSGSSRGGTSSSGAAKKGSARRGGASRVKRVAGGVVEQAQHAVVTGFEAVKGLGETLVDRVTG
jgi:hypothetical protein